MASARASAGAVPTTTARPPARSTSTRATPGTADNIRSTERAQPVQVMPETINVTCRSTRALDSTESMGKLLILSSEPEAVLPVNWKQYEVSPRWKVKGGFAEFETTVSCSP